MRFFSLISGCAATLCLIAPAPGALITFSDLHKDAALGVRIQPTGPDDLPEVTGMFEVDGTPAAFLTDSVTARFYSGVATFNQPATAVTFDVDRINNSGWRNPITIVGLENHKRVALTTVNLAPLGDTTHITITAPAINQVEWIGTDWIFHPYVVHDVQITFPTGATAGASSDREGNPEVGSGVPEPATCAIFGVIGAGMLLRRRKVGTL